MSKISIFDSGRGGQSVLEYLKRELPNNEYNFYCDSKNFPYGEKSKWELQNIGKNIIEQLMFEKPNAIVIACNTMCCALEKYQNPIPLIYINDLIVSEVYLNFPKGKKLIVLCTKATKESEFYQKAFIDYQADVVECGELVNAIENDQPIDEIMTRVFNAEEYEGIVLGCTHFNYIKPYLLEHLSAKVQIFDGLFFLKSIIESL